MTILALPNDFSNPNYSNLNIARWAVDYCQLQMISLNMFSMVCDCIHGNLQTVLSMYYLSLIQKFQKIIFLSSLKS